MNHMLKETIQKRETLQGLIDKKREIGCLFMESHQTGDDASFMELLSKFQSTCRGISVQIGLKGGYVYPSTDKQVQFVEGLLVSNGYGLDEYSYKKVKGFTQVECQCIIKTLYDPGSIPEGYEWAMAMYFDLLVEDLRVEG